jgi:CHAD domain-containing protein
MALKLRRREQADRGVRRLLLSQVQRIAKCVTAAPLTARHVHKARQYLKRLRALLRLLRRQVPDSLTTRGHDWCRTLAHSLAARRDATVLTQTLQRLRKKRRAKLIDFDAWQSRLTEEAGEEETERSASFEALNGLQAWAEELARWPLAEGWDLFAPGLARTYRAGRNAMILARSSGGDEDYHNWRKRVKDRWYQLALLRGMGQPKLGKYLAGLRRLAKQLGREHDLTMLIEKLAPLATAEQPSPESLVRLAERARRSLRRRALRTGRRLYAVTPRRDLKRLHRFWRAWRRGRD